MFQELVHAQDFVSAKKNQRVPRAEIREVVFVVEMHACMFYEK